MNQNQSADRIAELHRFIVIPLLIDKQLGKKQGKHLAKQFSSIDLRVSSLPHIKPLSLNSSELSGELGSEWMPTGDRQAQAKGRLGFHDRYR
ncbi:hypothetical protein [Endozoicomonas euniceicola]|uniref:Uncharacterized protein n=1 Tax=Endozoicomonas euniceicola TaxID=1234143 RepID=A0ABY6GS87_9GAMM|nr:hypothetical protein [Endozoicomonas euniceicola]UYM15614.1 hypothetical protein NX720_22700 [Endozoicomonas euniceicola]